MNQNHVFGMEPPSLPETPSEEPITTDLYEPIESEKANQKINMECDGARNQSFYDSGKVQGTKMGAEQDERGISDSSNNVNKEGSIGQEIRRYENKGTKEGSYYKGTMDEDGIVNSRSEISVL